MEKKMKKTMKLKEETLADILANYSKPEDFADIWNNLKKSVIEKMMEGELDHHLGYARGTKSIGDNVRNGNRNSTH